MIAAALPSLAASSNLDTTGIRNSNELASSTARPSAASSKRRANNDNKHHNPNNNNGHKDHIHVEREHEQQCNYAAGNRATNNKRSLKEAPTTSLQNSIGPTSVSAEPTASTVKRRPIYNNNSNNNQNYGARRNDCLFIGGKPVSGFLAAGERRSESGQSAPIHRGNSAYSSSTIQERARDSNSKCNTLIQQLPDSLAFSALNYLSNFRDSEQLTSRNRNLALANQFPSPKLSPAISPIESYAKHCNNSTNCNTQPATKQREPKLEHQQALKPLIPETLDSISPFTRNTPAKSTSSTNSRQRQNPNARSPRRSLPLIDNHETLGENKHTRKSNEAEVLQAYANSCKMPARNHQQSLADKPPGTPMAASKGKRFCLAIISLLVLTITSGVMVRLTSGQQLQPRSHGQLLPTASTPNNLGSGRQTHLPQHTDQQPGARQAVGPQPVAGSLLASVNCNKIRGHVTLTPNQQGSVTVSTQINEGPPGEVYQWSVHQFPVKPGAAMCTCSPLILGLKLIDLGEMHGNLPSNQEYSVQSSTLSLFGPDSPVGHSLLLRGIKTGVVACATFLPTSRKSNYRAKFHEPLSGSVTVFQTAFGSSFLSHLMYSNGTRRHSVHRFDLVRSDDDMLLLNSGHRPLTVSPSQSISNTLLIEQREHDNEINQCRRFSTGEPLLRNMTYQLSVSTENFGMRSRTALVLPQIPFETFSSVYVIVYSEHNPLEPIACAPLKFVRPKTAAAKFQTASVQGNVIFSQDSPYDPTQARISLQLPNSDGHSYGIDELPMIIRRKSDTRVCPNIREIIYNPHHIEPSSVPGEGEATSDQYAVGDLSGKYGSLAGKSSERILVSDFNLPLFGPNSIVGRAMTIYSAEGVAIACSNVELNTPMTTAFATFDFGIQGQFIFRQAQNDCNGDTYVYIEVSRPMQAAPHSSNGNSQAVAALASNNNHNGADNLQRTLDHNWHVHVNPIDSGLDHLSTTECAAAGPHFNPYNTSTSSIYSRDCTPFNVLRCELGDLASKMFTLEIPPYRVKNGQEPDIGKFFGTDIDLPLCGPVSIVNRSVVVHGPDFGMHRLACSTVIEFKPRSN